MLRDLDEIVASQHKMLMRIGKQKADAYPAGLHLIYSQHLETSKKWMDEMLNVDVLYVNYTEVVNNSAVVAQQIVEFLELPLEINKMTTTVDKSLYRERIIK